MLPTATDLKYFLTVAEMSNIRRAAERLRLAQPSLSMALRRLEDALGVPLLIRGKLGVQLTPAGRRFVPKARALLDDWERACSEAARDEVEVRGRYVIGAPEALAFKTLPPILARLLASHPSLEVDLAHGTSRGITADVVSSTTDFGIVANPARHPDLVIKRICAEEIRMWVSNVSYPTQDPRSGQAVLVYDPVLIGAIPLSQPKRGLVIARTIITKSLFQVVSMTAAGVGIGVIPQHVAALFAADIHPLAREIFTLPHDICLIYRADAQRSSASRRLAHEIEAGLRETMRLEASPPTWVPLLQKR